MFSVRISSYGMDARRKFGEHERSVGVAVAL